MLPVAGTWLRQRDACRISCTSWGLGISCVFQQHYGPYAAYLSIAEARPEKDRTGSLKRLILKTSYAKSRVRQMQRCDMRDSVDVQTKIKSIRSFHRVIRSVLLCFRSFPKPSLASSTPTERSTLFGCPDGASPVTAFPEPVPRPTAFGSSSTSYIRLSRSFMSAFTAPRSVSTSISPASVAKNHSQFARRSAR